jgi:sn-glycerol 3-phosphate transport system ATP-binding protein
MVRRPKVFLYDEPLSNLDAKLRVQMRLELRRLHEQLGATSVLVTHDQQEAMTLADHLVVMNAGRVEQTGSPRAVYERPASLFVAGFLGAPAMNLIPAELMPGGEVVKLAGGPLLRLAGRIVHGSAAVTLGIRPEHVASGPLEAEVLLVEDLGSSALVHARLPGGTTVACHVAAEAAPARGSRIGLEMPAGRLHLFDTVSGARLELESLRGTETPSGLDFAPTAAR